MDFREFQQLVDLARRLGEVADSAILEDPRMALQGVEFEGVAWLAALGYGMGRIVASLAINAAMAFGKAVKRLILSVLGIGMAPVATRLV